MLVEDNFEILDTFEILNNLLLTWESEAHFLNSKLYLEYLKYEYPATPTEINKWKDHLLEQKLKKIYTVEDLHNTLDQMEEINELAKKLDAFTKIIINHPYQKNEIMDNLELDVKGITFPKYGWVSNLIPNQVYNTINILNTWIYNIYDISITIWFHVL